MFENRVLKRISGPKWDGVTGGCRRLFNQAFNDLYSATTIIWEHTSRRRDGRCTQYEWGREEFDAVLWCGNLRDRGHLEERGIDGRVILKWILTSGMGAWSGLTLLGIGTGGGLL